MSNPIEKKFVVCSPPRTGSTLVWQIVTELSGKRAERSHDYIYEPNATIFVPYRDLRDAICSFANIRGGCNEKNLRHSINVILVVNRAGELLRKHIENLKTKDNVFLIKYEKFFGFTEELVLYISKKMGLSLESEKISLIADKFSLEKNKEISANFKNFNHWCPTTMIHGNHITNNGQVGLWKKVFTRDISLAVDVLIGDLLISLNYESDHNWVNR